VTTPDPKRGRTPAWLKGPTATLVAILAALLALTIIVTHRKNLTNVEAGLLQFIFFAASAWIALAFGRRSTVAQAEELVRRDAAKAVRRIVNLGESVRDLGGVVNDASRFASELAATNAGVVPEADIQYAFGTLRSHLDGQARTVADAIEDWRDLAPNAVAELDERVRELPSGEQTDE
jgi:hypothetical protein